MVADPQPDDSATDEKPARPEWATLLKAPVDPTEYREAAGRTRKGPRRQHDTDAPTDPATQAAASPHNPVEVVADTHPNDARTQTPEPPHATPPPEAVPESARQTRRQATQPQTQSDPAPMVNAAGETLTRISVYLPSELFDKVRAERDRQGTTYNDLILDELDRRWDELEDMFPKPSERRSPLPARKPRRRRGVGTPASLQMLMRDVELQVIDQRVAELQLGSRSELLTKVAELAVEHTER